MPGSRSNGPGWERDHINTSLSSDITTRIPILSLVSLYSLSVSHKLGLRIIIHHSFAHAVLVQEENVNYTVNSVHLFQFLERVFYNRKFQYNRLHVFKKKCYLACVSQHSPYIMDSF